MRLEIFPTPELLKRVDDWRRLQDPIPARAKAARNLILLALANFENSLPSNDPASETCGES